MTGLLLALALSGPGCSGDEARAVVELSPAPLTAAECEVCGMMVAEQPAPRGQLVYRDGTRAHYCSLGELRAALQAPSPHGLAQAIYVEALPAGFDPAATPTAPLAWVDAQTAWYVAGAARPRVMGLPVLSFADQATARAAADALDLAAVDWTALRETPFNQIP